MMLLMMIVLFTMRIMRRMRLIRKRMAKKKKKRKKRNKRKKKHDANADDDGEEWRWWWWRRRWWWWWWGGAFESDAWERIPKRCLKTRSEARPLPSCGNDDDPMIPHSQWFLINPPVRVHVPPTWSDFGSAHHWWFSETGSIQFLLEIWLCPCQRYPKITMFHRETNMNKLSSWHVVWLFFLPKFSDISPISAVLHPALPAPGILLFGPFRELLPGATASSTVLLFADDSSWNLELQLSGRSMFLDQNWHVYSIIWGWIPIIPYLLLLKMNVHGDTTLECTEHVRTPGFNRGIFLTSQGTIKPTQWRSRLNPMHVVSKFDGFVWKLAIPKELQFLE